MKWLSNVFKESLEQMLKETKVTLGFCTAPSFSQTTLQVFQLPHYLLLLLLSVPPQLGDNLQENKIPSASHLSLYFPILILKACWTPFSSSLTTCPASCCWRGLTTETSRAASLPLAKKGSRTSAGRSSLPGRSPAGSFRGLRAAWDAAVRRMKWSIGNEK